MVSRYLLGHEAKTYTKQAVDIRQQLPRCKGIFCAPVQTGSLHLVRQQHRRVESVRIHPGWTCRKSDCHLPEDLLQLVQEKTGILAERFPAGQQSDDRS